MFGFLKNKLKEWVDKAKEKLTAEEKPKEAIEEKKEEKIKKEKPKKEKKAKKKEKLEEKKEEEVEEEKAEKIEEKEIVATKEDVKKIKEEQEEVQHIAEKIQEGKETPEQAVEELEEVYEKTEKEILQEKPAEKKGFISRLFGRKKEPEKIEIKEKPVEKEEVIKIEEKEAKSKEEAKKEFSDLKKSEPAIQEKTFFQKVKSTFTYKITEEDFNSIYEDLEMLLLENNVALEVTEDLKKIFSKKLVGKEIPKKELESEIKKELKNSLNEILIDPDDPLDAIKLKKTSKEPFVILFFGINGTGKTTSIAKFANLIKTKNMTAVLAAADTFRAASIEQISEHAARLNLHLIKHDYGADPAAVGFDAIKYAKNHHIDVVLIDTAGRMHTKTNLLEEMKKICRITNPDLKIFVAESIAGNDATEQARTFNEMIQIDGIILTKADVDEKGGTIISVSHVTRKPIFYLGTGQKYEDLELFNKEKFIEKLGL